MVQISAVFGKLAMLLVEESSKSRIFRDLFHHIFRSPEFQKYINYEEKQSEKMFFVSEITASELAILNCLIKKRIFFICSQYINKNY